MKQYKSYLCILLAAAAWGCIGLFSRRLLNNGFSPANIVTIRNFGGLLVLSLIFALFDRNVFRVKAKHLPIFFGTGIVSVLLFTLCYFNAQKLCSLAVSAILLYTAPAMVVVMSAVLWKEPITKKKLLALFLALLGCALRFLCSYITGVVAWGEYMPDVFFGMTMTTPWFYSALYNGFYMLTDCILVLLIGWFLWKPMGKYIRGDDIKKLRGE